VWTNFNAEPETDKSAPPQAAREIIREPAREVRSVFVLSPAGLFAFAFPRPTV
jgi:hypothetical protein